MEFDHQQLYYRVIGPVTGDGTGYAYREGEAEIMLSGEGLQVADYPKFEFDDIAHVGKWLQLGSRVRVLRVPASAEVVANRPMSQGGCMTYSADRIELLEVIGFDELLARLTASGRTDAFIDLEQHRFGTSARLPAQCRRLSLYACSAESPLALPRKVEHLFMAECELSLAGIPEDVAELHVRDCILFGIDALPQGTRSHQVRDNLLG